MKRRELPAWVLPSYVEDMGQAIQLFNAFHAGRYERVLLALIRTLRDMIPADGDDLSGAGDVQLVWPHGPVQPIPAEAFAFLTAAAKQLGDMAVRFGGRGEDAP